MFKERSKNFKMYFKYLEFFPPLSSQISLPFLLDFSFQTSAYFGFSKTLAVGQKYLRYGNSLCLTGLCCVISFFNAVLFQ